MRICQLCGALLKLDKVFPAKLRVKKRERYKCTDPSCTYEENITPSSEAFFTRLEEDSRVEQMREKKLARQLIE